MHVWHFYFFLSASSILNNNTNNFSSNVANVGKYILHGRSRRSLYALFFMLIRCFFFSVALFFSLFSSFRLYVCVSIHIHSQYTHRRVEGKKTYRRTTMRTTTCGFSITFSDGRRKRQNIVKMMLIQHLLVC